MPAYAKAIPMPPCSTQGCPKPATHIVHNAHNEVMRPCCHDHAKVLVKFLNGVTPKE